MTSISLGVEYSSVIGGRYYGYFTNIDGDRGFNAGAGNDAWDTILGGTVRKDNSWATIKFIADSWNQVIAHSFGIDNIAGTPWSFGFDTHDTGTTNLGQQFMGDLFNDFKADPFFNTCDMGGSFNFKYITDSFEFRAEAQVYDADGDTDNENATYLEKNYDLVKTDPDGNEYIETVTVIERIDNDWSEKYTMGFIFKNELGKFYIGGKTTPSKEDAFIILGADLQINDELGLKLDFWSDESAYSNGGEFANAFWSWQGHNTFQATVTYNDFTGQLVFSQPEAKGRDDIIGIGASYRIDRWLVGAKYFDVDEIAAPEDECFYDIYGMYNVGAWDIKFGTSNAQFAFGQGGKYNEGAIEEGSSTQASEADDPFVYAGFHFEF
jgi:hypothetical protein